MFLLTNLSNMVRTRLLCIKIELHETIFKHLEGGQCLSGKDMKTVPDCTRLLRMRKMSGGGD